MFTGIVEELGRVRAITPNAGGARIEIDAATVLDDATIGASIAVNGCCLTVVELGDGYWAADAVVETLARTNLGDARARRPRQPRTTGAPRRPAGRSPRAGPRRRDRHGARAARRRPTAPSSSASTRPADVLRYVVHKGSITVDGISLTVAAVHDDGFSVAVIPHTLAVTTLGARAAGARVNLEVDLIAKYVERLLVSDRSPS